MASKFYRLEWRRAREENGQQLKELQARWPQAFPRDPKDVRPLAGTALHEIAAAMGWSKPYTRALLSCWKNRGPYCRAVLCYNSRIALSGEITEQVVDDDARKLARARLDVIQARIRERTRGGRKPPSPPYAVK
jgi:hypothetical protein